MLIGVISDTHGTVHPSVAAIFEGVDRIIHAGDVGSRRVLDELELIAPVIAVRGNMDTGELAWRLQDTAMVRAGECRVLVVHKVEDIARGSGPDASVVVSGHTHRARIETRKGVLYVNPGPAGSDGRDGRGPTVALLDCTVHPPQARIIDL